jgi:hypothetical protein
MGAVPTDYDAVVEELTAQVHAEPQERPLGNAAASETGTCRVRISEIVVPARSKPLERARAKDFSEGKGNALDKVAIVVGKSDNVDCRNLRFVSCVGRAP